MKSFKYFLKINTNYFYLLLALFILVVFSFLNVDYSDNPFQINSANYYLKNNEYSSTITFFTEYVYSKIIVIFNDSMILFRLFNSFLILFALFAPLFFLKTKLDSNRYIAFATVSIVFFLPFSRLSIGWDALSDVYFFLIAIFCVNYINSNKKLYLVLMAFVFVFATYTKITNILLLVFVLAFIVTFKLVAKEILNYKHLGLLIFCTILFFHFFLFFFFEHPKLYYFSLFGDKNLNESYSVFGLLERIFNHIKFALKPLFLFYTYYLIFIKFKNYKYINYVKFIWGLLFLYLLYNFINIERGFYNYVLVISSFIIIFLVTEVFKNKAISNKDKIQILFIFFLSFFPTIGSNTGLSKNSLILFFPLILVNYNIKIDFQKYKIIFCLIVFYVVCLRSFNFIDFQKINSDFSVNSGKLYPIVSSNATKNRLNEIDNYIKTNDIKHFYFYSLDAHLFEYYFNGDLIFLSFDRNLDNETEWKRFKTVIENTQDNVYLFIPKNAISEITNNSVFLTNIKKYKNINFEVAGFVVYKFD